MAFVDGILEDASFPSVYKVYEMLGYCIGGLRMIEWNVPAWYP